MKILGLTTVPLLLLNCEIVSLAVLLVWGLIGLGALGRVMIKNNLF